MTIGCYHLFNEVGIDPQGDVYPCCKTPSQHILGNIKENKLMDIVNNRKAKLFRLLAFKDKLDCYNKCIPREKNMVNKNLVFNHISTLFLARSYKCNLNCVMCEQNHRDKNTLDTDVILNSIDFSKVRKVVFTGGEPLLIKDTLPFAEEIYSRFNTKMRFLTNGTVMNENMAHIIVKCCDNILISINGADKKSHESVNIGSSWEKVLKNIKILQMARKEQRKKFYIGLTMTVTRNNLGVVKDFRSFAESIGTDYISFGIDDHIYLDERTKERMSQLFGKIRGRLIRK